MSEDLAPSGVISLTTDFGLRDHYVAAMKAVLLARCPAARIVDVSHEVPAFDRQAAAYVLGACHADFPRGTVHVVVVDPGVGSAREALVVRTRAGWLVGPGNGCLDAVARDAGFERAWRIARSDRPLSSTFHGRDLFAPVAGRLAAGDDVARYLEPVRWRPRPSPAARRPGGEVAGRVVWVDRFGNLVTTIARGDLGRRSRLSGEVGGAPVSGLYRTYAEAPAGVPFFLWGSGDRLEVSVREGSAARALGVEAGCGVRVYSGR
jgi:S-adenosylmethionine hydrolase